MLHYVTTVIVVVCDVLEPWVDWQVFTVQQAERKYPPHDVSVFLGPYLFRRTLETDSFNLMSRPKFMFYLLWVPSSV